MVTDRVWVLVASMSVATVACGEEAAQKQSSSANGTSGPGGGPGAGGSGGSTTSGGAGGAGGPGGAGGGSSQLGPCHGATDDFSSFDASSSTDYWTVDTDVVGTAGHVVATPTGNLKAGLASAEPAALGSCFTSIALGGQVAGNVYLMIQDPSDEYVNVAIDVDTFDWDMAENVTPGPATIHGEGPLVGAARTLRLQVLPDEVRFEIEDDGGWKLGATLAPPPAWLKEPALVLFYFQGSSSDSVSFDDFNLAPPPPE